MQALIARQQQSKEVVERLECLNEWMDELIKTLALMDEVNGSANTSHMIVVVIVVVEQLPKPNPRS
nr:hypothetical protein HmN_000988500 [Hymenolepis microstoma]